MASASSPHPVIARVREPLMTATHDELARTGAVRLGELRLAREAVHWSDKDPLPHDQVESIELFNSSPVRLRVMKRGAVLPYAQAETAKIPRLHTVFELARALGYRVCGLGLGP